MRRLSPSLSAEPISSAKRIYDPESRPPAMPTVQAFLRSRIAASLSALGTDCAARLALNKPTASANKPAEIARWPRMKPPERYAYNNECYCDLQIVAPLGFSA